MHSRPELAWLQMERQRGKKEQDAITSPRTVDKSSSCKHKHTESRPERPRLHQPTWMLGGEKTQRFRTPARRCNHGCSRAGGKRVYPTHSTPTWVCNPTSAEAVVWIPACCQPEWKREGSRIFLSVFLTFCFLLSPPAVIVLSSRVLLRCSVSVTAE